jgi:hypothetical protein
MEISERRGSRSVGLDAVRASAVLAMVVGHTADALLASPYKDTALFALYTGFRGMTASLFLFVSGWAVVTRAVRREASRGEGTLGWHLRRAGFLWGLALLLRWPAWDVAGLWQGGASPWKHLLGMDALACIALCLGLSGVLLALIRGPAARAAVFFVLAGGAPFAAGWASGALLPGWLAHALTASADSPFPVLPWGGYFFAGGCGGLFLARLRRRQSQALLLLGTALLGLGLTAWHGLDALPLTSPVLFTYRLGYVAAVGGLFLALPPWLLTWTTSVGRASLTTYVLHLPLLYGWGRSSGLRGAMGASLSPFEVCVIAGLFMLAGSVLAAARRQHRTAASLAPAPPVQAP